MNIVIDTETQGLNAQKFLLGVIAYRQRHNDTIKHETFNNKHAMYERIWQLAEQCQRNHKTLTVYGHNLQYDYIALDAHKDMRNYVYCSSPFIVDSNNWETHKTPIKWIDTMGLWRGSLESLGETLGTKKTPTPEWLTRDEYNPDFWELQQATEYCKQDCTILINFLEQVHDMVAQYTNVPRLYTASQISMKVFLSELRKTETTEKEFYDHKSRRKVQRGKYFADIDNLRLYPARNYEDIYESYRGGRCEAFQQGFGGPVDGYDINSLYPYIATTMRFPDLRTENKIHDPLKGIPLRQLLAQIGVTRAIVKTPVKRQEIGVLPVRLPPQEGDNEETIYPVTDSYGRKTLISTWTNIELQQAVAEGYEIIKIPWSIIYQEIENPLRDYMLRLYEKKLSARNDFEKAFFKMMMNGLIGKFAQHRDKQEVGLFNVEEIPQKRSEGWETIDTYGLLTIMRKNMGVDLKKSHAPIIATLITAGARVHLYNYLRQIPREHLWYCDTDSIYCDSIYPKSTIFKLSKELGDWKEIAKNEPIHVYGKKAYMIGDTIKVNRVPKKAVTKEAYLSGQITYKDIIGTHSINKELIGTFKDSKRELNEKDYSKEQTLFIDHRTRTNNFNTEEAIAWVASEQSLKVS